MGEDDSTLSIAMAFARTSSALRLKRHIYSGRGRRRRLTASDIGPALYLCRTAYRSLSRAFLSEVVKYIPINVV